MSKKHTAASTNVVAFPGKRTTPPSREDGMFDINAFITGGKEGYVAYVSDGGDVVRFVNPDTQLPEWVITRVDLF